MTTRSEKWDDDHIMLCRDCNNVVAPHSCYCEKCIALSFGLGETKDESL